MEHSGANSFFILFFWREGVIQKKKNEMFESSGHPGSTWPVLRFHRACRKGESAQLFLPGPGFCWVQATTRSRWFLQGSCPVALGWQTEGCLSYVLTCTLGIYCEVNFYLSLINARRIQASHHILCSPFQSWIFCFRLFFPTDFTILLLACLWGFLSTTCT